MDYNYTIRETHSNSKNDLSPVILHDAYTSEWVIRDGSDLVFLIEDGIIVRPNCTPNETGRYLQTDAAEIRLRDVEKISVRDGGDFPCVGEQFIILRHQYRSNQRKFSMLLINNQRHGERWFDFICGGAEYRFNRFAGDSGLQKVLDWKMETMRTLIRQGHGAAVLRLRKMSDEERRDYAGLVIHAACNDLRRDHQCDAERTQYILDLLESYCPEDRAGLVQAILQNSRNIARDSDIFGLRQYVHLLERLCEDTGTAEILRGMYETVRQILENRPEIPEGYDELPEKLDFLAKTLGMPAAEEDEHVPHPRPADPPLTIEQIIETVRNPSEKLVHPARFRGFFLKKATSADVAELVTAAKNEPDPDAKARLYSLFTNADYPDDPAELLELAKAWEPHLSDEWGQNYVTAFTLQRALARLRHPAVRAYGLSLTERTGDRVLQSYGFNIWVKNYEETDFERFCNFLEQLPPDDDPHDFRHSAEFAITHNMFEQQTYKDPRTYGHLVWVYSNTFCSCCRSKAVAILHEHGMLQEAIRKECLFDCDPETRKIAQNTVGI